MGAPKLPDLQLLIQAGINPKTGLPIRLGDCNSSKEEIKKCLRIIDEQDAVNRYVWYNLPNNITSQELERLIYYKGQLCFFYNKDLDEFYFMPYALDGTIDFYGRFNRVHPVPMTSGTEEKNKSKYEAQCKLLSMIKLYPKYGIKLETPTKDEQENSCVLLHDYTKQLSQTIIPRVSVNEPILDVMAECIPYMSLNLLIATGISGIRTQGGDERDNVVEGAIDMKRKALAGIPWVALDGKVDFQELSNGVVAKSEEYMLAMQSLDNFRLGTYGIENGGLFEKKAHVLEGEQAVNGGPVGLVMQDGLSIRQNFCNIVNSIWGLGVWCEPSENINGMDMDGDGNAYDDNLDGSNGGVEGGDGNE